MTDHKRRPDYDIGEVLELPEVTYLKEEIYVFFSTSVVSEFLEDNENLVTKVLGQDECFLINPCK
jgi:hypothetical protein